MTSKGATSGTGCCCGGCLSPPAESQSFGFLNLRPLQQTCCTCIPNNICVSFLCGDTEVSALFQLTQCLIQDTGEGNAYFGSLPLGDDFVDLYLYFRTDSYGCWFCVQSSELGISGDEPSHCVLVDDAFRGSFCAPCQDCPLPADAPLISWDVTVDPSFCYALNATITAKRAPVTSLIEVPLKAGCVDECNTSYEDACGGPNITHICDGCTCVCRRASIMVKRNGRVIITEDVDYTSGALALQHLFEFASGWSVEVVANPDTNLCELALIATGAVDALEYLPNVPISDNGSVVAGRCPTPVGTWSFQGSDYGVEAAYEVLFHCANCDDSCTSCSCIATYACILILNAGVPVFNETVRLCNGTYTAGDTGYEVSIGRDPDTRACQLELVIPYGVEPDGAQPAVLLDDVTNPCPFPRAVWRFQNLAVEFPNDYTYISFTPVDCDGGCLPISLHYCCPVPVPPVLFATVTVDHCYGCDTFQVVLVYEDILSAWVGEFPAECDLGLVTMQLLCQGQDLWTLVFGSDCLSDSVQNIGGSCNPMGLAFSIEGQFPLFCCEHGLGDQDGTIGVVIND